MSLGLLSYVARWRGECDQLNGELPREWHPFATHAKPGGRPGRVTRQHVEKFVALGLKRGRPLDPRRRSSATCSSSRRSRLAPGEGEGGAQNRRHRRTLVRLPGRWWVFYIPGILDVLWPLWDKKHQCWHDKVVNSIVIRS